MLTDVQNNTPQPQLTQRWATIVWSRPGVPVRDVTRSPSQRGGGRSDQRFDQRLSPLIVAVGVTAIPNLLLRYQGRLKLTSNEVVYVQHVLMHRWGETWPWVAISTIVESTGAAERSVRDWKASLMAKGFLAIHTRGRPGGGRGADEHDLSKLFAALEALALEEELQRASDDARQQLPTPTYFRGDMASVPQVGARQTRKLQTERVRPHVGKAAENRRIEAAESRRANLPESAAINLPVPAREEEAYYKKPSITPPTPMGERGSDEKNGRSVGVMKADDSFQPALPKLAAVPLPAPGCHQQTSSDQLAIDLLTAFYRGLGADANQLTATHHRRQLAKARELVKAGATAEEAEAYAREANLLTGRLAPLDLRWFDRERPAWLARWRRQRTGTPRSAYEWDPWEGRKPPISEADLARGAAL